MRLYPAFPTRGERMILVRKSAAAQWQCCRLTVLLPAFLLNFPADVLSAPILTSSPYPGFPGSKVNAVMLGSCCLQCSSSYLHSLCKCQFRQLPFLLRVILCIYSLELFSTERAEETPCAGESVPTVVKDALGACTSCS